MPLLYLVFLMCHHFVPKALANQLFSEKHEQRTLLIGPLDRARKIEQWIEETAAFGFGMRGSATDDDAGEARILHLTSVSDVPMLERIISNEGIRQILLLVLPLSPEALDLIVSVANKTGARLLVVNDLSEIFNHDITLFKAHGQEFISLRDEPLEDPLNRIFKRAIDILVSLPVVILVLPPLCILVKSFQAFQSPGPLFYRQTRARLAGLPFRIVKFRSMRVDRRDDASKQATAGDPRIYALGKLLGETGIDEIPQFLSVLVGHMSLVGPRPHMIVHTRRFRAIMNEYHIRTFAKPGITGLAQLSGFRDEATSDEEVKERAKLDIKYIENWSLPLDFWIILKTVLQIVMPSKRQAEKGTSDLGSVMARDEGESF